MWALSTLQCDSTIGQEWWRLGGVIGSEEQSDWLWSFAPKAASEQSKGNNFGFLHRQCIGDSWDLCLQPTWARSPHGPPYFSIPPLWGKGPDAGWGETTCLKGTESAQAWTSGLLLQQLGIRPCPDRIVIGAEQRGSPTSHPTTTLAPPSLAPHLLRW